MAIVDIAQKTREKNQELASSYFRELVGTYTVVTSYDELFHLLYCWLFEYKHPIYVCENEDMVVIKK